MSTRSKLVARFQEKTAQFEKVEAAVAGLQQELAGLQRELGDLEIAMRVVSEFEDDDDEESGDATPATDLAGKTQQECAVQILDENGGRGRIRAISVEALQRGYQPAGTGDLKNVSDAFRAMMARNPGVFRLLGQGECELINGSA